MGLAHTLTYDRRGLLLRRHVCPSRRRACHGNRCGVAARRSGATAVDTARADAREFPFRVEGDVPLRVNTETGRRYASRQFEMIVMLMG